MGFGLSLEIRHELHQSQKMELQSLLGLLRELRHPEISEATRGLEGIKEADRVLRSKNIGGLLIGGLAKKIWHNRTTLNSLSESKDVDVLVAEGGADLIDDFEGGIDWWHTYRDLVRYKGEDLYERRVETNWHMNANGIVLMYSLGEYANRLLKNKAGLFLPDPGTVDNIIACEVETLAAINGRADADVVEEAQERLSLKSTRENPPKALGAFEVLHVPYFEYFDKHLYVKINDLKGDFD